MFTVTAADGKARRGRLMTAHGAVQTPVFMNVATQAAIKGGLSAFDLTTVSCQTALCNTYHLHVRPGEDIIRGFGGLHRFMGWNGPILTDSGGFQVFSLAGRRKITEAGVAFASHVDGRRIFMGPEESVRIQAALGSDIAMAFDECVSSKAEPAYLQQSCDRTTRWLERCTVEWLATKEMPGAINPGQMLFGINQGGTDPELRKRHMYAIAALDLQGYAIGGLAVGETAAEMYDTLDAVLPETPVEKPRYLMGVGTPGNIIEAAARGIDMFDCVLPARNARHGHVFTGRGVVNLHNTRHKDSNRPIDDTCGCHTCKNHSRAYLRHLLKAGEMLYMRLAVWHNLHFYNTLMERIRAAIENRAFSAILALAPVLDGKEK
jgi:queuine tRNA-ribosyltransferase